MSIVDMARVSAGGVPPCGRCPHGEHGVAVYLDGGRTNLTILRDCADDHCRCADRLRKSGTRRRTRARYEDRGRHSGVALTEVRTVLSRARSALYRLEEYSSLEYPPEEEVPDYGDRRNGMFDDPDLPDMKEALRDVIAVLERWEKTGRTTRSTCL